MARNQKSFWYIIPKLIFYFYFQQIIEDDQEMVDIGEKIPENQQNAKEDVKSKVKSNSMTILDPIALLTRGPQLVLWSGGGRGN